MPPLWDACGSARWRAVLVRSGEVYAVGYAIGSASKKGEAWMSQIPPARGYVEQLYWGPRYDTICDEAGCAKAARYDRFGADCFQEGHRCVIFVANFVRTQLLYDTVRVYAVEDSLVDVCRACRRHERDHVGGRCLFGAGRFVPGGTPLRVPLRRVIARRKTRITS
jgi:hypothetical protein